ncbi:unnamed protein product, partial [Ectocarpus fasciculatus]
MQAAVRIRWATGRQQERRKEPIYRSGGCRVPRRRHPGSQHYPGRERHARQGIVQLSTGGGTHTAAPAAAAAAAPAAVASSLRGG